MVGDFPRAERAEQDRTDDQSVDAMFDVLSDRRRRHVLASVLDHGQGIALSELAEDVATRDTGASRGEVPPHPGENRMEVSGDPVQKLTVSLYHTHLPKLEEAGYVEYDPDSDVVRPTESIRQIEHLLALTDLLSG